MKKNKLLFCFSLLLTFSCISIQKSKAQNTVSIEGADRALGAIIDGESVRRLLNNVIITSDNMRLEADSAYQFIDRNRIQAFNIQIETENEVIWADSLFYNSITEYSEFRGRVIIQSENNTIFSEMVDLIPALDVAVFDLPVRFEDERGTLLAESGLYYQEIDSAAFYGNVQLVDSTQYLEADSLFMNRSDDLYELRGRVFADDFEDKITFAGNYLYADSLGYRLLTGDDAWLMEVSESDADTTHLLSRKIEIMETDTASFMDAYQDVRIWSTKFAAFGDTVNYRDDLDQFTLRSSPVLWQNNIQLTGPFIEATFKDDDIEFLRSYINPIVVQEDSVTGRLNQMTGDTLNAYFEAGDLKRMVVFDNSEIIFHLKDEDDEPDGLIEMIAIGSSTMTFNNGEFEEFKAERNPDGSYLPEDPANIGRRLDNFRWDPDLKPQRPEILTPRLPEITPDRPFELPERYIRYLQERTSVATKNSEP